MALPLEILDHIFSFLRTDLETLRVCCESHPSLSQLAELHLYSHIRLTTDGRLSVEQPPTNPFSLTKLLAKRPQIAYYICSLKIRVFGNYKTDLDVTHRSLEEISTILPILIRLKAVGIEFCLFSPIGYTWEDQPENFRIAFLASLRLPSLRAVTLNAISRFPFMSALNGECKALRSLTVVYGDMVSNHTPNKRDFDHHNTGTSPDLQIESLRFQRCGARFFESFVPWFTTHNPQLRSLEFSPFESHGIDFLPPLLASSSNSLTTLDLDLGIAKSHYSDFNTHPIVHDTTNTIPFTLSSLPHLEQLTIHAEFEYIHKQESIGRWGVQSPLPVLTKLFSHKALSSKLSLKHLILSFNFTVQSQDLVQTKTLPWSALSEVICYPLVRLLSTLGSSDSSSSIRVDLRLSGNLRLFFASDRAMPLLIVHYLLSQSKEFMQLMQQGTFVVEPSIPTSFDMNNEVFDCW